jgi:hypothetical protein
MSTIQHDERYKTASDRLRKQLRNDKAYEEANEWALRVCREAEQFSWPSRPPPCKILPAGKSAAELADHLDHRGRGISDLLNQGINELIQAAEKESGMRLRLDAASFANYLRALAEQCRQAADWHECGPLVMKFTDKNQIKMPPKATALAVALTYGFRRVPDWVKNNTKFTARLGGLMDVEVHGQPCLPAAVLFANIALKAINEQTSVKAVKQWLKNNRGRIRYWGFGV